MIKLDNPNQWNMFLSKSNPHNLKYTIKKPKKERCQKDAQWSPKPQSFSYNPQQPPTSQQPQQVPFHVNGKPWDTSTGRKEGFAANFNLNTPGSESYWIFGLDECDT